VSHKNGVSGFIYLFKAALDATTPEFSITNEFGFLTLSDTVATFFFAPTCVSKTPFLYLPATFGPYFC
jgi:hypothetical protein